MLINILVWPDNMQIVTAAGATKVKEGTANSLVNPNAPPDGTVTITTPKNGETWDIGSRHEIQWTGTGKGASLVNVTLWIGDRELQIIGTDVGSGHIFYKVDPMLAGYTIELRVTSSYDTRIEARQSITIHPYNFYPPPGYSSNSSTGAPGSQQNTPGSPSYNDVVNMNPHRTLTIVQPNLGATLPKKTVIPIKWNFTGDIGPNVQIIIISVQGGAQKILNPQNFASGDFKGAQVILNTQVSAGTNHTGNFNWTAPDSATDQQYVIIVASLQYTEIGARTYVTVLLNSPKTAD